MANLSFSELLGSLGQRPDGSWSAVIPDNWMQGRTTYGGLSAAICLQAVNNQFADLPPLRSAQMNFIGPAGGSVTVDVSVQRQGRSVTYLCADLFSEKGLATHAVFCFGSRRESRIERSFTHLPKVPSVAESKALFVTGSGPAFTSNFDCLLSKGGHPNSGSEHSEHYLWARHKDRQATGQTALISIADVPPPAVLPMFKEPAPISSMTWMMNFLTEDMHTADGWWLMRCAAEHSRDGYSSQDMQVWNTDGDLMITGRQNVAIFY